MQLAAQSYLTEKGDGKATKILTHTDNWKKISFV
jgi:hypothetical protein